MTWWPAKGSRARAATGLLRRATTSGAVLLAGVGAAAGAAGPDPERAASRAVAYLAREVPAWRVEHECGSCHNNGDAARALLRARERGHAVEPEALASTLEWLSEPDRWEEAPGEPGTADLTLARLQFGAALAVAVETGAMAERGPLLEAARRIAGDQRPDGSWRIAQQTRLGSPVTWGRSVATWRGVATLRTADPERYAEAIARARDWAIEAPADSVMDAAALLLLLGDAEPPGAEERRSAVEAYLLGARGAGGGWGPWPGSPPEAFDTALALLALQRRDPLRHREVIGAGRRFLAALQLGPGGWPETTRPAGYQSYAQHVSTSGWAALALLETAPER